ncbi:MAG: hypothetical protein GWP61_26545 [Chloroflexi bacterium]|jgi:hypothetical protein|nr:hypothetical protein [Chloroflexota bacterium]
MKNSNHRMHFLNSFDRQLRDEPGQMGDGQVSKIVSKETLDPPDRLSGAIAIAAIALIFASIFLVQ